MGARRLSAMPPPRAAAAAAAAARRLGVKGCGFARLPLGLNLRSSIALSASLRQATRSSVRASSMCRPPVSRPTATCAPSGLKAADTQAPPCSVTCHIATGTAWPPCCLRFGGVVFGPLSFVHVVGRVFVLVLFRRAQGVSAQVCRRRCFRRLATAAAGRGWPSVAARQDTLSRSDLCCSACR